MTGRVRWLIEFYADPRGNCPVAEFLDALPPEERAKLARVLALLGEFGPTLGMPHARPVAGLWELRAGAGRLFYVAHAGRRFIVLHGYRKRTRQAPAREIETARRRWAEYLERDR